MDFKCKNCGAKLTTSPEPDHSEWIMRCFRCGALNVVTSLLQLVGWRE